MSRLNKYNFLIKENNDGTYCVLQRAYLFKLIPTWKEIKYNENNKIDIFKFNNKIRAMEFISEICD
jgi:hypothetical protein